MIERVGVYIFLICSVRVANELGRGSSKAAKFSILVTVLTSFCIGFVLFLVFLFLRERLAYVFTPNPKVAEAVGDLSPLLSVSMLLNSVQPVLSGNLHIYYYYCDYYNYLFSMFLTFFAYNLIFVLVHLKFNFSEGLKGGMVWAWLRQDKNACEPIIS